MRFSMLFTRIFTAALAPDDGIQRFSGEMDRRIGSGDDVRSSIARRRRTQG
jgi:hypothetical protein